MHTTHDHDSAFFKIAMLHIDGCARTQATTWLLCWALDDDQLRTGRAGKSNETKAATPGRTPQRGPQHPKALRFEKLLFLYQQLAISR